MCDDDGRDSDSIVITSYLEHFAKLVVKEERLAIKKIIEEEMTDELDDEAYHLCMELIAKILKRGAP